MPLKATQLSGFGVGGAALEPFEVTFLGEDHAPDSTGTTNTFNSFNLGNASASRRVYVLIYYVTDTNFVQSVTIGGQSAAFVGGWTQTGPTPDIQVDLWMAEVPNGTTGNVAVNFTSSYTSAIGIVGYRSVGATDDIKLFAFGGHDSGTVFNSLAGIIGPKNTIIVGALLDSDTATFTWTNVDEDADVASGGTNPFRIGAASRTYNTHQGQADVTVAITSSASTALAHVIIVISGSTDPELNWFDGPLSNTTNQSSYTFSNVALGGNPGHNREKRTFVVISNDSSTSVLNSVTIDGVAATIHATSPTGVSPRTWIASRKGEFAATGTVVVTFSGTVGNCTLHAFKATNLADNTPHDSEVASTASGTSVAVTIDLPGKGILIVGHRHGNTNNTSISGAHLRNNFDIETQEHAMAANDNLTAATGASVSASWTTNTTGAIAAVSWK